ncbi:MAG: hypothetical protein J5878_03245 [Oscillospiraceae bacterium]|nr:hypothetical protein [Oscillospiraceae bacterium]
METKSNSERSVYVKAVVCLVCFIGFFSIFAIPMGLGNALNTMMNTAYALLTGTVFYIMAIAVMAGALSGLLTEFGVVALLNKLLSPLMGPLFGMPGASALGMVSTYLSDNPAILTLADDKKFRRFFKAYQIPALTNLGTAFGMGLIVTSFTLSMGSNLGSDVWKAALCGNLGAIIGAIVSTRLMLSFMKKAYGTDLPALDDSCAGDEEAHVSHHKGFLHVLDALMEGGKKGVDMGLTIIPGVLIICSIVMILTNGRPAAEYKYAMVQQLSEDGIQILSSTGLIEIPDAENYIYSLEKDSTDAKWRKFGSEETDESTYSYLNGRHFETNDHLYVRIPSSDWGEAGSRYCIVLYKADETTKIVIPLTADSSSADSLYSGVIPEEPYRGNSGEGVGILPWIANLLSFILKPLFGFSSAEAIAVPVTALGSAGAALGLIPNFARNGLVQINDLAVFTAVCMCWSGYLSTHVSMMEVLGCREHTGKAIISHTIGGLCAGIAAHWIFVLVTLL